MIFKDLLDIGRAYQKKLVSSPIEWAEVQANFLIRHGISLSVMKVTS
jgi:hypothetical protein